MSCLQLLFAGLAVVMLGVRSKGDRRDRYLHHGSWLIKLVLWLAFNILPFLFPNPVVNAYGEAQTHGLQNLIIIA